MTPDQMRVLMNVPLGGFVGLCISSAQGDEMSCVRLTSEEPQARPPLSNSPLQQYKQQERQYK